MKTPHSRAIQLLGLFVVAAMATSCSRAMIAESIAQERFERPVLAIDGLKQGTPAPAISSSFAPATRVFSLEDAIYIALLENPELRAAYDEFQAKLQKIPQARSMPDPMISYTQFVESVQTRTGEQQFSAGLSQKFPWFGKLTLQGEIANAEAQAALEAYHAQALDVIEEMTQAYHNLAFERAAQRLTEEEREYLSQFLQAAAASYASGGQGRLAVLKAQTEISRVNNDLAGYAARIRTLEAQLNRLMNRDAATPLIVAEHDPARLLDLRNADFIGQALANRPELRRLDWMIEKSERQHDLARKDYWPDVTFGVNYIGIGGRPDDPAMAPFDEGKDAWNVAVMFNLPLQNPRRRAQLAEARIWKDKAEHEKEAVTDRIEERLDSLQSLLRSLNDQLALFENSLLPLAGEMFETSRADYETGKMTFLDLLDAERMLLRVRMDYLKAARDYNLAVAELERTVGAKLQVQAPDSIEGG
ncbi:TolC family protein [Candidatus Sumerlaeota bacterium]|nr:TolC family protein [Candidatus Sumerlaeota bacterium]